MKDLMELKYTTRLTVVLIALLAAGCSFDASVETAHKEARDVRIKKHLRANIETALVVVEKDGLKCAVFQYYDTGGAGMSCDWATYKGN